MRLIRWTLGMVLLSRAAWAQPYPPPIIQQAPPDPHQFCYYNGMPYSLGAPYPGRARGEHGRPMRCAVAPDAVNGYLMLEWSDSD